MRSHGLRWARISVAAFLTSFLPLSSQAASKVTVGPGTTLDSLARKFDVPKADIAKANGIHVDAILVDGRVLTIPDPQPIVRVPASACVPASVKGDRIAVRRGPGTDYGRLTLLDSGARLTVTARKGGWCQVKGPDVAHGWVRADLLAVLGPAAEPGARVAPASKAAGVKPPISRRVAAKAGSRVASLVGNPVRRVIRGDRVSVRKGASTGSERLMLLDDGATVTVIAKQGEWCKLRLSDARTGWVSSDFVAARSRTGALPRRAVAARPASKSPARRALVSAKRSTPRRTVSAKRPTPRRTVSATKSRTRTASSGRRDVVRTAYAYRGTRYRYGGASRGGFDCSGFTRYVYGEKGVDLPHSAAAQFGRGSRVAKGSLKSGDLVFFSTTRRGISHVGIYVGDGKFVHASSARGRVRVDSLAEGYYSDRFRGARRVK